MGYALAVSETYSVSDIDELPSKWQTTNAAFDGHNAGFTTDEVTSQDNEVKCVDNGDSTDICYFCMAISHAKGGVANVTTTVHRPVTAPTWKIAHMPRKPVPSGRLG